MVKRRKYVLGRITAEKIKQLDNPHLHIWHLATGRFALVLRNDECYWSPHGDYGQRDCRNWNDLIAYCRRVQQMGLDPSRFHMHGSMTWKDNDLSRELGVSVIGDR